MARRGSVAPSLHWNSFAQLSCIWQPDGFISLSLFVFSLPSPLHPGWSLQAALLSPSRSLFGSWWDVRDVVVVMNLWPDGEKCDDSARKKEGQIERGKCRSENGRDLCIYTYLIFSWDDELRSTKFVQRRVREFKEMWYEAIVVLPPSLCAGRGREGGEKTQPLHHF